jgi:hypothetical protein
MADFDFEARFLANLVLGHHAKNRVFENEQEHDCDDKQRDDPERPFKQTFHDL